MEYHSFKQNYSQWNITNLIDGEGMTYLLFIPTSNQGKNMITWWIQKDQNYWIRFSLKTKYCTVTDKVTSEKVKVKGAYVGEAEEEEKI
jgi:hypothetical protein